MPDCSDVLRRDRWELTLHCKRLPVGVRSASNGMKRTTQGLACLTVFPTV